jgi:hypothetical protein
MKANKLLEDLFGSRVGTLKIPEQRDGIEEAKDLCEHIIAMADDSYLMGHPEWEEITTEASNVLSMLRGNK